MFSVHVTDCTEIQDETTHTYNYDNFGDIFLQGYEDSFNTYKYENIATGYEGPHVGGAFLMKGTSFTSTNYYNGYIVDITTTYYCGRDDSPNEMYIHVYYLDGEVDVVQLCGANWRTYTWIPETRFSHQGEVSIQK